MLDVLHLEWSFWRVITRAVHLHCDGYVMQQDMWVLGLKIKDKTEPSFAMLQIHKISLSTIQCSSFFSIPLLCWCEWRSIWTWDLCLFLVMNSTTLNLLGLIYCWIYTLMDLILCYRPCEQSSYQARIDLWLSFFKWSLCGSWGLALCSVSFSTSYLWARFF